MVNRKVHAPDVIQRKPSGSGTGVIQRLRFFEEGLTSVASIFGTIYISSAMKMMTTDTIAARAMRWESDVSGIRMSRTMSKPSTTAEMMTRVQYSDLLRSIIFLG